MIVDLFLVYVVVDLDSLQKRVNSVQKRVNLAQRK